ncbi:disease resistance protein At4g27190-like [Neltuma alba]|uniref:disease resistance protein At4g27190-like n=1 Tax=Neltuma alba TaxID=207710 RepID=UPI0010A41657|nr:disease resistance protein At4g27190-like [Prosopis alba]
MAPGIDILVNCAGGVGATAFIEAVKKATRYWWEFTELVENLGGEIELLESVCGSMEVQVINAGANSRVPGEDIVLQLKNAATLLKKAKDQEMKAKASSDCCNGAFPNLICRCIVGRKTEKMTNKMKELKDYLQQKLDFAHRSSLRAMSLPQDFIFFDSIEKARDEIITALKDDTKLKIGLFGMGGCGKSSMLKIVHKEAQDRELFEKIAFVEVSDPPNILDIQQAIASWIDLNFETEMDKHARAARLSMTLEKDKSYLIILDNVWRMLKFDEIGIPSRKNCKVLLSTRHKDKCTLMDCQKVIPVPHLTKDEAWELFQQRAGAITEEVKNQAEEVIVDYCRGLPVAIRAVASTLKGKRDYAMMEALTQLKHHTLWDANSEEEYNPYKCLKFSFEELKIEKEKSLYLLCALFPNDAELTLETLIRFAFGLGIFQDVDSYQSARRTIPTVIDKFKDSCLLLQEKGQHVKLHDMFRAVALSEANEKTRVLTEPSQNLKDLDGKQYFKETTRLYYHGTFDFPHRLNSPELEILYMSNDNGYLSKFPATLFEEITKLKVLAIKDTSGFTRPALLFPQSFERLEELRTLCLNGWRIDNMSCFEKLKMLHSMELSSCEVKELPEATLKKLKLLEVSCCIIGANPYEVLARCSQLKELYFVKNSVPNMVPNDQNVATFIQQLASYQVLQRKQSKV